MEKVKLPRKVAEAIEQLRGMDFTVTNWDLVFSFSNNENDGYPALVEYAKNNFDYFLSALVNGYEVEQTPEDMLKKFFEENVNDQSQRSRGVCIGIIKTLDILGKFIEGVNVEWDAKNT